MMSTQKNIRPTPNQNEPIEPIIHIKYDTYNLTIRIIWAIITHYESKKHTTNTMDMAT